MRTSIFFGTLLNAGALTGLLGGPVWAQEKHALTITNEGATGKYVQQLTLEADDVPGHQVRAYEIQRTYIADKGPMVDGERITETWTRGTSSLTNGVGPASGFTTWNTDAGGKIFVESTGVSEGKTTETGSKRGTYHGMGRIVGGTGRFAKIRGVLVETATFDNDPKTGYSTLESRGEYWYEK